MGRKRPIPPHLRERNCSDQHELVIFRIQVPAWVILVPRANLLLVIRHCILHYTDFQNILPPEDGLGIFSSSVHVGTRWNCFYPFLERSTVMSWLSSPALETSTNRFTATIWYHGRYWYTIHMIIIKSVSWFVTKFWTCGDWTISMKLSPLQFSHTCRVTVYLQTMLSLQTVS